MLGRVYELAKADFVQRTRNSRYVAVLVIAVVAGNLVANGAFELVFGEGYAAAHNGAWLGGVGAMAASTLVLFVGFFLIKGTIERDDQLGVGELIAASPVSATAYLTARWLSNVAYLVVLLVVLWTAAVLSFAVDGEAVLNLWLIALPFVAIAGPTTVFVASVAILFETVESLRHSLGNFVYFFGVVGIISAAILLQSTVLDPIGFTLIAPSMEAALTREYPGYSGQNIAFTFTQTETVQSFTWTGVDWGRDVLLKRLLVAASSVGILVASIVPFDRFDPSKQGLVRTLLEVDSETDETPAEEDAGDTGAVDAAVVPDETTVSLTPVDRAERSLPISRLVGAELRLAALGRSWWWYAGAAILVVGGLLAPPGTARGIVLPVALIWGFTILSASGVRDRRYGTTEFVMSSRYPVVQIVAVYVANTAVLVGLLSGVCLTLAAAGSVVEAAAVLAGASFVPSLALAAGTIFGTARAFELFYLVLWYAGTLNGYPPLDFAGASDPAVASGTPWVFGALGVGLLCVALGVRYARSYR